MIIGSNFKLSSRKFLDDRQQCQSLMELSLNEKEYLYPLGFEVYCIEEGKWYQNVSKDKNVPIWEERKGNGSLDIDDVIADGEVLSDKTWSSEYIDSFKTDLELLLIDNEDYLAEIEDRVLFIEGSLHYLENFDGSYDSLTNKPIIPTKTSELINDAGFAPYSELDSSGIFELAHGHHNMNLLDEITEERIAQWDNGTSGDSYFNGDYNYLDNKPLEYLGDDSSIIINLDNVNNGTYIVNGIIGEYSLVNELTFIKKINEQVIVTLPNLLKVLTLKLNGNIWTKINEIDYQIDKNNANINNSLNIGEGNIVNENNQIVQGRFNEEDVEGKYINIVGNGEDNDNRKNIHTLDWNGNAWYNGKLSQEGVPVEDKDLTTKGYVDGKFATSERVEQYIEKNDRENARRDVIIDALANGRKRTVEIVDGEGDLLFATEKDTIFIDKIEGETLVNVCDQEEPIPITKEYTVEGTNHIPLQGEYDGKCRPFVYGNTLVNRNVEYDKTMKIGQNVNANGTMIEFQGTKDSEVQVSLDGHTVVNLGTKKGGELYKSFDNGTGNEISLVGEGESKTDVVCEGDTLVNLWNSEPFGNRIGLKIYDFNQDLKGRKVTIQINTGDLDTTYMKWAIYRHNNDDSAGSFIPYTNDFSIKVVDFSTDTAIDFDYTKIKVNVFEGDLTQTPHLIPTEYVEGMKSTFEDKYIPYSIYDGTKLTSVSPTQYQLSLTVKTNIEYTIITTINTNKYQYAVYSSDGLNEYYSYTDTKKTSVFICDTQNILFKVRMNPSYEGDDYEFIMSEVQDKFLIVEGNWEGREYLLTSEYFGKYKVDMRSVGKNLFDINGNITEVLPSTKKGAETYYNTLVDNKLKINRYSSKHTSMGQVIKVKPNTQYTISCTFDNSNSSIPGRLVIYDYNTNIHRIIEILSDLNDVSIRRSMNFTTNDCTDIFIGFTREGRLQDVIENDYSLIYDIQLEEGTVESEYEPYFGTNKTIYLNSPLLKGDRIEMYNGKLCHYHKMGKAVLDGSENWWSSSLNSLIESNNNLAVFGLTQITLEPNIVNPSTELSKIYSDKFLTLAPQNTNEYVVKEGISTHYKTPGQFRVAIKRDRLSTTDVNGFKQWLAENPTTVIYELAEPYYEEISVTENMIFNISSNSTLTYESAVPMGNTTFLSYVDKLNLLKSSTQYTISFNCDVEGILLEVSLGGTKTNVISQLHNTLSIITPPIETDGKLMIDGYGIANIDNVVITAGEMAYEYFEGLKSSFENEGNKINLMVKINDTNLIFGKGGRIK
ncbi:MAG: hypothetical protein II309_07520 [Bacilli bacterium]|nr:hypothetical protein [Bacilli bacterium]